MNFETELSWSAQELRIVADILADRKPPPPPGPTPRNRRERRAQLDQQGKLRKVLTWWEQTMASNPRPPKVVYSCEEVSYPGDMIHYSGFDDPNWL